MTTSAEMIFMMGLPAAGKSTWIRHHLAEYYVIDPDEVKQLHPHYHPKRPHALHLWSKVVAATTFRYALQLGSGYWAVHCVGANAAHMRQRITAARASGFYVGLVYLRCRLETALARNARRQRTIPEGVILAEAGTIEASFEQLVPHAHYVIEVDSESPGRMRINRQWVNPLPFHHQPPTDGRLEAIWPGWKKMAGNGLAETMA